MHCNNSLRSYCNGDNIRFFHYHSWCKGWIFCSVEASLKNYKGELTVEEAKNLAQAGKKEEAKKLIEEAKKDFKEAVAIDPNYVKAKKNLSRISMAIPVTL
ncbi:MAG TPA: hypothetical protein PLZ29_12840 [Spirochaetota bacterium]|nr:hypothetical protein [Spirochaetota bacterium]